MYLYLLVIKFIKNLKKFNIIIEKSQIKKN